MNRDSGPRGTSRRDFIRGMFAASAALGLGFSTTLIGLTRYLVARFSWARRLHVELRPVARDLSAGQILLVAGLSSLGEELLFRGLLTPTVGVVLSGLLFGLAHQIKGPSRWVWAGWAMTVGLGLGAAWASGANDVSGLDASDLDAREQQFARGRRGNTLMIAGGVIAGSH